MNKLKKPPTSNPPPHTHAGVEKTLVIHTHVVEGLDSTNKQNAPTRHPHTCAYTCTCIHIHKSTYIYIHTYAHAHIHAYMHTCIQIHVYAHQYTDRQSHQRRLNAWSNIIDAHMHLYTYACISTCICIYTYAHNLQRMCCRCVRWCQRNICITHTAAHALVPRTPVLKCMQHPLQKNAHVYIHTHVCIRMNNTCASMTLLKHAEEWLLRLKISAQTYTHIQIHMYIYACVWTYIYTCRYIHICMFVHTRTYTYIHTHTEHVTTALQRLRNNKWTKTIDCWMYIYVLQDLKCIYMVFQIIQHIYVT